MKHLLETLIEKIMQGVFIFLKFEYEDLINNDTAEKLLEDNTKQQY